MHKLLIIVFLFVGFFSKAQQNYFETNYQIGAFSSGISLQQAYDGSGNFLSEEYKENFISNLSKENSILIDHEFSMKYARNRWGFALENHITASIIYPEDLVKLTLNGNTPYLGETLSFADLSLDIVHYSEFKVEYQAKENVYVSLSYLAGHQFAVIDVKKADFYTSETGETISYDIETEAHFSDSNEISKNLFAINGSGMSVGVSYNKPIGKGKFNIKVSDVGFIKWNEETSNLNISNEYEFNGIEINDLADINDSIIENELEELNIDSDETIAETYSYWLPYRIQASYIQDVKSEIIDEVIIGLEYRNKIYHKPRLNLDLHKHYKKHEFVLGYHILGVEHSGFQFAYKFHGEKSEFKLFSKQINYLDAKYVYGTHIGIGIKRLF